MYTEDELLPVSYLQHLLFCERRVALIHIEGLWEDNQFTAEGSVLHARTDADLPVEVRCNVRITRGLLIRSMDLGLSGKADVVEFHRLSGIEFPRESSLAAGIELPGANDVWQPFPVEYKRGRLRHEEGYEIQLCAQAMCLEEMLEVAVPRGAIFFGSNRRRKQIEFDTELRSLTIAATRRLHDIIDKGVPARFKYEKKCQSCSLVNLCLPRVSCGKETVTKYMTKMLSEP